MYPIEIFNHETKRTDDRFEFETKKEIHELKNTCVDACVSQQIKTPEVGGTYYRRRDSRKYHVIAILDKEDRPQIISKYFGHHKRWWHYEIESLEGFKYSFELGSYSFTRFK